jgi:N-methylhydantoinase A
MRIGIDIGGTFTDFVVFDESSGNWHTFKLLSTPADPATAVLDGLARLAADTRPAVVHGSTVATNALLERKGARTALITTCGFRDILTIGRQVRTDIYDLFADRPPPLVPPDRCLEVTERVDHHGQVLVALQVEEIPALIETLRAQGIESVAVSLLFSFLHPEHEARLAADLRGAGFLVSASSEILPEFREYERASTVVVNAYVAPVMDRYLGRLEENLSASDFRIMQSNGGSIRTSEARRQAVRSILSGPAGGVVGALHIARAAGFREVITFDMGGTSTDVSLSRGEVQVTTEAEIGGLPIRIPVVNIHTVGSGGGSIAYLDAGGALRVGPESAGADPGPVAYGRGGRQPTVTDANLTLGRLAPDYFLGGQMPLDVQAAASALANLAQEANLEPPPGLSPAQAAALGVIQVVNAHMERALRVISVERGYDPGDFTLVSFGGAGGLHACDLARGLGMRRVVIPRGASTLSAFGMLAADVIKDYVLTVMLPGETPYQELERRLAPLAARGRREVTGEGIPPERISLHAELDMRYVGQSYELTLPLAPNFVADFHAAHKRVYGHSQPGAPIEVVNVRLRAVGAVPPPPLSRAISSSSAPTEALAAWRPVVLDGGLATVPFYLGERLTAGNRISGPAVIAQPDTTILLFGRDRAWVDEYSNIVVDVTTQERTGQSV